MRKLNKVTKEQSEKLVQIYDGCDKFYHADVIKKVLNALDIDYYFDTYTRSIVFDTEEDELEKNYEDVSE